MVVVGFEIILCGFVYVRELEKFLEEVMKIV